MCMAITLQNANAYFAGRTLCRQWNEYSGEQKDAAILQARRDLSRALGRPMRDDEPPYREGDRMRDEYAVYEQAVYALIRSVSPEGSGQLVQPLDSAETHYLAALNTAGGKFSLDALSWLADEVRVTITR